MKKIKRKRIEEQVLEIKTDEQLAHITTLNLVRLLRRVSRHRGLYYNTKKEFNVFNKYYLRIKTILATRSHVERIGRYRNKRSKTGINTIKKS